MVLERNKKLCIHQYFLGPDKLLDPVRWVILCLMFWGQTAKHLFPPFKFGEPMPTDSVTPQQESQRYEVYILFIVFWAKLLEDFEKYNAWLVWCTMQRMERLS
jgi:hypothetical protein